MMDRRRSPRVPDDNSVVVTVLDSPATPELQGKIFFCQTGNISEGGVMIRVNKPVPQGAQLSLRLAFAKPIRAFDVVGKVAWTSSPGPDNLIPIGIEFVSGKGRDLESWQQIVNQKIRYLGADTLDISPAEGPDPSLNE